MDGERKAPDLSRAGQATTVALRSGNLVGPWRPALPPPTPGWGRGLARGAGCSGLGCQHSPLHSTHSRHRTLLSAPPKPPKFPSPLRPHLQGLEAGETGYGEAIDQVLLLFFLLLMLLLGLPVVCAPLLLLLFFLPAAARASRPLPSSGSRGSRPGPGPPPSRASGPLSRGS